MKNIKDDLVGALVGEEPEAQPTDVVDSGVDKDEEISTPAKKKLIIKKKIQQPEVDVVEEDIMEEL